MEGQEEAGDPLIAILNHFVAEVMEATHVALAGGGDQVLDQGEVVDGIMDPVIHGEGLSGEGLTAGMTAITLNRAEGLGEVGTMFGSPAGVVGIVVVEEAALRVGAVRHKGGCP